MEYDRHEKMFVIICWNESAKRVEFDFDEILSCGKLTLMMIR